MTTINNRN